jgi:hypothetical protein
MSKGNAKEWPALPLVPIRKSLGYLIPLVNIPLLLWNIYQTYLLIQTGTGLNSQILFENVAPLALTLLMAIVIPRQFPVYQSSYYLEENSLTIKRLLIGTINLPYKNIDRIELYIKEDIEIPDSVKKYAVDESQRLSKTGFKFKDFTNSEQNIMNMMVEDKIYMISPEKPKSLVKELKSRNGKLTAKIVELHRRGKRVRELK